MEKEVSDLAILFGLECCINEEKPEPCLTCRYKASQVIRFGYRPTPPLEAQQGEDEVQQLLENFQELNMDNYDEEGVSNLNYWATQAYLLIKSNFRRPSQSASREIKWPEKKVILKSHSMNEQKIRYWINETIDDCKAAVASAPALIPLNEAYAEKLSTLFCIRVGKWCDQNNIAYFGDYIIAPVFENFFRDTICKKFATKAVAESSQSKECEVCHTRWVMCDCEFKEEMKKASQSVDLDVKQLIDVWIKTNNVVLTDHQRKQLEITFATKKTSQSVGMNHTEQHLEMVKPLVEALESTIMLLRQYKVEEVDDGVIANADKVLATYKPNAGRQG